MANDWKDWWAANHQGLYIGLGLTVVGIFGSWYITAWYTGENQFNLGIAEGRSQITKEVKDSIAQEEVDRRAGSVCSQEITRLNDELSASRLAAGNLQKQLTRSLALRVFDSIYDRASNTAADAADVANNEDALRETYLPEMKSVLEQMQVARQRYGQIADAFNNEASALLLATADPSAKPQELLSRFLALVNGRETKELWVENAVDGLNKLDAQ